MVIDGDGREPLVAGADSIEDSGSPGLNRNVDYGTSFSVEV
jgi:hypothetical protein